MEDVPADGRGVGTRWALRSLPTLTIPWFCFCRLLLVYSWGLETEEGSEESPTCIVLQAFSSTWENSRELASADTPAKHAQSSWTRSLPVGAGAASRNAVLPSVMWRFGGWLLSGAARPRWYGEAGQQDASWNKRLQCGLSLLAEEPVQSHGRVVAEEIHFLGCVTTRAIRICSNSFLRLPYWKRIVSHCVPYGKALSHWRLTFFSVLERNILIYVYAFIVRSVVRLVCRVARAEKLWFSSHPMVN